MALEAKPGDMVLFLANQQLHKLTVNSPPNAVQKVPTLWTDKLSMQVAQPSAEADFFIDVVEKGRDLRKQCFPPLNKTGNMWGDDKVRYYGWDLTSYKGQCQSNGRTKVSSV
jgi:hypothetical protein